VLRSVRQARNRVVRRVEDGMDGRLGMMRTGGESLGGDGKGMLRKVEAGEVRNDAVRNGEV
tara:strand:+ start:7006 stop:7188 length:183 start_codon:yes stop_codon:yes gene_type:complete